MYYVKVINLLSSLSVFLSVVLTIFGTFVSINSVVGCLPFSKAWNYVNPEILAKYVN